MAFNSILRSKKTQPGHRAVLSTTINRYEGSFVPKFNFSSVAIKNEPNSDETLLCLIESKITCTQETDEFRGEEVPSNFPFKIVENPRNQTIILKRTYQGEKIEVKVHMVDLVTGEEHDKDDESERATQSSIDFSVSVSKKNGTSLEFCCDAYPDEMVFSGLFITNRGEQIPYYDRLDFQYYLEIRGIKPSTTNFLQEYMIKRKSREYLVWLNKLKNFIKSLELCSESNAADKVKRERRERHKPIILVPSTIRKLSNPPYTSKEIPITNAQAHKQKTSNTQAHKQEISYAQTQKQETSEQTNYKEICLVEHLIYNQWCSQYKSNQTLKTLEFLRHESL
ncbi:glycoprotein family protein [Medicago truncatula]|uniref:Glycoprotein family protein n=1 Tax=Medicago truncatula TaxID=3880 RepID=G7KGW2_MEDTR|nr:glycoprotein family protein [Medicago truncatula]